MVIFKTQHKKQTNAIKWVESLNIHLLKEHTKSTQLYENMLLSLGIYKSE